MGTQYQDRIWLKHYPTSLPADIAIPDMTGLEMWQRSVEKNPESPAIYYFDHPWTYGQIDTKADALAVGLQELRDRS